jgi:hypothetical protein
MGKKGFHISDNLILACTRNSRGAMPDGIDDLLSSVVTANLMPSTAGDDASSGNNYAKDFDRSHLFSTPKSVVHEEPLDVNKDADLIARLSNDLTKMSDTLIFIARQMVKTEMESAMSNIREEIAEKVFEAMQQMKQGDASAETPVIEGKRKKLVAAVKDNNTVDTDREHPSIFPSGIELEKIANGKKPKVSDVPKTTKTAVKVRRFNIKGKQGCSSKMAIDAASRTASLVKKIRKACLNKDGNGGNGNK